LDLDGESLLADPDSARVPRQKKKTDPITCEEREARMQAAVHKQNLITYLTNSH